MVLGLKMVLGNVKPYFPVEVTSCAFDVNSEVPGTPSLSEKMLTVRVDGVSLLNSPRVTLCTVKYWEDEPVVNP